MMGTAPRDRRVMLLLALVVTVILVLNVASALVPGMDGLLASVPVIVAILIIIATAVLAVPQLPEGTARISGYVAAALFAAVSVWKLKPTSGRRGR